MHDAVTVNGVRLAYRVDGPRDGPVVAFANSLGTTMALWDREVALLSGGFRVLRYDLRGHGGSAAPPGPYTMGQLGEDLVGLLDALGIARVSLCGLSIGGMVALQVAGAHPERVERLVVACSAPALPPASSWRDRAAAVRAGGVSPLTEALFSRWFTPEVRAARPSVVTAVGEMLATCDPEGYAACCEAIAGSDLGPRLGAISAPTLVIAGNDDPVAPPMVGLEMARAIGDASFVTLAGAAHLAHLNQPERFASALVDHLAGAPRERGMAVRRFVLGDAHVERALARETDFTAPFQDFITRYAWGEIWSRPGLERKIRSAITVAMLVALGRIEELSFHAPAALRNGLSEDELREILLQCAVYAGVPAANSAFAAVAAVLAGASDGER
jgi:3-oxoadipate enol-lactonase/4-carboxymuconolactone decarboxylase